MRAVADAFWRASLYCVHPRVIAVSLLPLALAGGLLAWLGWMFWEDAVSWVRGTLERWLLVATLLEWLGSIGAAQLRTLVAPLLLVAAVVPLVVLGCLLLVATLMTPAIVALVQERRFPELQRKHGAGWWQSLGWGLACSAAALLALLASVPLWFVPPMVLVLPPLIWGWLTCRVLGFDVLAAHASPAERRVLLHRHRWTLLAMGLACGLMGALPSMLWGVSVATLIFAPVLLVVSVWMYMLLFAFAAAWYAHFLLAELHRLRQHSGHDTVLPVVAPEQEDAAPAPPPPA
jgi:hypothetical protein